MLGPFERLLNALVLAVLLAPLIIYGFLWTQTDSANTRTRTIDAVCAIVALAVGLFFLAVATSDDGFVDPQAPETAGLVWVGFLILGVPSFLLALAAAAGASIPNASWRKPTMVMILVGMIAAPILFGLASVAAA